VAIPVILALLAAILLSTTVIFAGVRSLKAEAAEIFIVGLLFSAGLSIVPILILRYLDRRQRESPWLFAVALLWGALIATGVALPMNTGIIMAESGWSETRIWASTWVRAARSSWGLHWLRLRSRN
jgi:protease PrsW